MNTQKQIILIVVLVFALAGGCAAYAAYDLPTRFEVQENYQYEGRVERGALLYANNCRTCHGIKGEGFVGPVLNKPEFKDQAPLVLAANQALIRRTLECGRAGTRMPAWLKENGGALSRIQIEHLVELITSPASELDENGEATSKGWLDVVEFGHNLNHAAPGLVSGDTLGSIAKAHNIGPSELLKFNDTRLEFQSGEARSVDGHLKRGSKIRLLPTDKYPDGYEYQIRQDNETLRKISDSQSVGAVLIAGLNGIPYSMDYKTSQLAIFLDPAKETPLPGLLPGNTLKLPEGATYTVVTDDTITKIAEHHGISTGALQQANPEVLRGLSATDPIDHQQKLKLPNGTNVVVAVGETLGTIAAAHGLEGPALAERNGRADDDVLNPGEKLKLPDATTYIVQAGDTLESIAAHHDMTVATLKTSSGATAEPNAELPTSVTLALPKVEALKILGQSIDDVAKGYGGISADDLAKENGVAVNERLYIGTTLALPPDTYGTAPPDAINPGTACVQYAVTSSGFEKVLGTNFVEPTAGPAEVTAKAEVDAHSNDWTVVADGTNLEANRGVITVAKNAVVTFKGVVGLHTITLNGKKDGDDLTQGTTRDLKFPDAGKFKITCDYHPDMLAYIFVQ